jgi:uncharacterized protein YjbI with pentapeptide repeats
MSKDYSFQDLSRAYLGEANLHGANFTDANLSCADLSGANLQGANLRYADLRYATLRGANLDGALIDYQIEEGLLLKVAQHALQDGALDMTLDMTDWHSTDTTHSIAGWAAALSEKTYILAVTHGHEIAGLLTLGHEAHKYFFASDEDARVFLQSVIAANE